MSSKQKIKSKMLSLADVSLDFDIVAKLHDSQDDLEIIHKYFPGDDNISRLNFLCSLYLHDQSVMQVRPTEGAVRECLLKMAELFDLLQDGGKYAISGFQFKLNPYNKSDPVKEELAWFKHQLNMRVLNLDDQVFNEVLLACSAAAKEAAGEIPGHGKRGGSAPRTFNPDRSLIRKITDLYFQIHGEWPTRRMENDMETGPLD